MYAKVLKAVWLFSILGFMVFFIYIYASLPEQVVFTLGQYTAIFSRTIVFYTSLFVVTIVNSLVFLIEIPFRGNHQFRVWFLGQIATFNLFFITALGLVLLLNSGEQLAHERIGITIYGSMLIMTLWAIGGLAYFIFDKINKLQKSV